MMNEKNTFTSAQSVKPKDYTDAGNAKVFTSVFKDRAIYVEALGWLIWNGQFWKQDDLGATALAVELSEKMLSESLDMLSAARQELTTAQGLQDSKLVEKATQAEQDAKAYLAHAHKTRNAPQIARMLELSKPDLHVELDQLDADPFLLNTPGGVVDLRTGRILPHNPKYLCANITKVSPDNNRRQLWSDFLWTVTCGDKNMEDYLQQISGMAAYGKVFVESIIFAYGGGGNGKSTLFNPIAKALGSYGGTIKPEVLTTNRRHKGADLATLKGKRLIIASELEEGDQLSSGMLKQLASTDRISGERKYHDPEDFTPSHTLILYTNHLPAVTSTDHGTWRRITTVKFNAKIQTQNDIKNYGDILFEKAGGAILQWVIDGAIMFCNNAFKLSAPQSVLTATQEYMSDNDGVQNFIDECCECGAGETSMGGELYTAYRLWAEKHGEHIRRKKDFTVELVKRGFSSKRQADGVHWYGISLRYRT